MNALTIYLIGWLILSVGHYVFNICTNEPYTKKLIAWRSFWVGFFSWVGILFIVIFVIIGSIFAFNEWVEEKLNK